MRSLRELADPPGHRAAAWIAALALMGGSVAFLAGGRAHPAIDAALAGPDQFFLVFAQEVAHTHGWHAMHLLILIGPLCWAVAAPALLDMLLPRARAVISIARSFLLLAGALWAVAFVLDGFGAPVYARAIVDAETEDPARAILTVFEANAVMMSRLGLVSWVTGGLGMAVLGGSLLSLNALGRWGFALGALGIVLGVWPLLAAMQGEYAAGPFTSGLWKYNALAVGFWYMALATCAFFRRRPSRGQACDAVA